MEGPEPVVNEDQRLYFVRQWCPSTLTLEPLAEIVTETNHSSELKQKVWNDQKFPAHDKSTSLYQISAISNIPTEFIDVAKGKSPFPCNELDVYNLHSDLLWIQEDQTLDAYPFSIHAENRDEVIIIYKWVFFFFIFFLLWYLFFEILQGQTGNFENHN